MPLPQLLQETFSQREIENAVEIAHIAGWLGYLPSIFTPVAERTFALPQFIGWGVEFQKTGYEEACWKELIESFARGKMIAEVRGRKASFGNANPEGLKRIISRANKGACMSGMPIPAPGTAVYFLPPYDSAVCDYTLIEIQACGEDEEGDTVEDNDNPSSFRVYLRLADFGEDERPVFVADFKIHKFALAYAIELRRFMESRQTNGLDPVGLHDKFFRLSKNVSPRAP